MNCQTKNCLTSFIVNKFLSKSIGWVKAFRKNCHWLPLFWVHSIFSNKPFKIWLGGGARCLSFGILHLWYGFKMTSLNLIFVRAPLSIDHFLEFKGWLLFTGLTVIQIQVVLKQDRNFKYFLSILRKISKITSII
jgi:hypothetical protein